MTDEKICDVGPTECQRVAAQPVATEGTKSDSETNGLQMYV
jgi:hypothetical protein